MKERSLVESAVAILKVLIGSIVWVVRLLLSMAQDGVKKVLHRGDAGSQMPAQGSSRPSETQGTAASNDDSDDDDQDVSYAHTEAAPGLTSAQHADLGGVPSAPRMNNVAAANLSEMGRVYDEESNRYMDEEQSSDDPRTAQLSRGIPNLEEPGSDEMENAASSPGEIIATDEPVSEYAGQPVQESDIGVDREDDTSDLADSPDNALDSGVDAYDIVDPSDTGSEEDADDVSAGDGIPAASRGWNEEADDPLAGDPLYGEAASSEVGDEVDLRNDEATEASTSGMHLVDSPDEPFIEEEPASEVLGLDAVGGDLPEIDDVSNREEVALDEDMFAADATGRPIGDDPASGDLGASQSFDDTQRDPGESREPGDVLGAYDGSGVDEFANDELASDMLDAVERGDASPMDDVSTPSADADAGADAAGDTAADADEETSVDESTQSAAWASSSGVVDESLTHPVGADELEGSHVSSGSSDTDDDLEAESGPGGGEGVYEDFATKGSPHEEVKAPQYDPEDASLRDVAAGIADDIDVDGPRETSGTPGDAGQEVRHRGADSTDTRVADRVERRGSDGPAGSVRGDGTTSCPADYPIKGNARSRIYHTPADASYEGTVAEFCFATEEDARAAGFRPRKA